MRDLLVAVLLSLPVAVADRDEPAAERRARFETIAQSIVHACAEWPGLACPALLVTIGTHESHFARNVHAGRCEPHECDAGLAATPWQLHRYTGAVGLELEATEQAALEAARRLRRAWRYCGDARGAIAIYASGSRCDSYKEGVSKRLPTFQRVLNHLVNHLARPP